jgi:antitoxin component YwqK of YwqJK toxin-antitoxin module
MKKIVVLLVLVFGFATVQAQERIKKNTYIQNGDRIEAVLYFDTGEVSQTGFYTKAGKLTGEWVSYNLEGKKTATALYDNGAKVGTWFFWNEDTLTEVAYENSRIASVNTWKNKDSRVVSNK